VLNVVSSYGPQVGSGKSSMEELWKNMVEIIQWIPINEDICDWW